MAAARIITRRSWRHWLVFGLLVGLASCNKNDHPPLVQVQGQVFVDNLPAHKAIVWLRPLEPTAPGSPCPHGVVDKEGSFVVGTYKSDDGAPAGKYRPTVYWRSAGRYGDEAGESLIPYRYMDPVQSGLPEVEVENDPITLPAFRLTTR